MADEDLGSVVLFGEEGSQVDMTVRPVTEVPDVPGRLLEVAAPLARQVTAALHAAGRDLADPSLVRVVANDGSSVAFASLARAVGGNGGARGFIHGAKGIKENVRLVKPSQMRSLLNPALPVAAATIALDMIAQKQQMDMLEEIKLTVGAIRTTQLQGERAGLLAAEELLSGACAKVFERGVLGPENGVDAATMEAGKAFQIARQRLDQFKTVQTRIGQKCTAPRLDKVLEEEGLDSLPEAIRHMAYIRLALTVKGRSIVLQQGLTSTDRDGAFLRHLDEALSKLAEVEGALTHFEQWLTGLRIEPETFAKVDFRGSIQKSLDRQYSLTSHAVVIERRAARAALPAAVSPSFDGGVDLSVLRFPDGRLLLPA